MKEMCEKALPTEAMIRRLEKLSRDNRVFTDALIRHLAAEIRSFLPFDETWFHVELPYFVGGFKGEIQTSAKSSIDFKTPAQVLHKADVDFFNNFIRHCKRRHMASMRDYFKDIFNDSTLTALN